MVKDEVSWTQMKKYRKMPESKFFEMMDKAHPEWKIKSTLISKKKAYALQQAKRNTEWMTPSLIKETVTTDLGEHILKAGKNKGKVKMAYDTKKTVYIPANKKSLTNYYKKQKEAEYKWLVSRGKLKGLTTYDWSSWGGLFTKFHGGYGSSDAITTTGIKGYEKGTIYCLIGSLANAHHGVKLDASDKKCLKYWGLNNVKPVEEIKKSPKKKTVKRVRKAPTKKKTVRRVRKAPAKKKTTTKKKKAPAKKKTVRRVRKAPAKKKTTRRKK
ncbi:MAG: hypothetical protein ACXAB8_17085 [Promethearchaeota archaeon]|jgi:hypothetical protein